MVETTQMLDKHTATVKDALSLIKRTFRKAAGSTPLRTIIIVPREVLSKIARDIDPESRLYQDPVGDVIYFNGIAIVAEESGEGGIRTASEQLTKWVGA